MLGVITTIFAKAMWGATGKTSPRCRLLSQFSTPFCWGDREIFVREMMKSRFDVATYYYRNCAEIEAFRIYHKGLPNIANYVSKVVFFRRIPGSIRSISIALQSVRLSSFHEPLHCHSRL